jgi:hypothetical protein
MAQNYGGMFPLNPDMQLEAQDISRRRALADMLTANSLKPIDPMQNSGKYITPISPVQGLAQLGQALLAAHSNDVVRGEERDLGQRSQARMTELLEGTSQPLQPQLQAPQFGAAPPSDDPNVAQFQPSGAMSQPDSRQQQGGLLSMPGINADLARALRTQFAMDPSGAIKTMVDVVKPTELQRDMTWMGMTPQDARQAKYPGQSQFDKVDPSKYTPESVATFAQTRNHADLRIAPKTREFSHRDVGDKIEYFYSDRPQEVVHSTPKTRLPTFAAIPTEGGGVSVIDTTTGNVRGATGPAGNPVQAPLKPVPETISRGYIENNVALGKIDAALASVGANPKAFGLSNLAPDMVVQRLDPQGVEARARVGDIGSLKIHDRSGAAVSASEFPRLKPFIPQVTDSPEVVLKKLTLFKQEYELTQAEYLDAYGPDRGFKGFASPQPIGAPQSPPAQQPQPGKAPRPGKPVAQVSAKVLTMADALATAKARGVPVEAVLQAARDKGYQVPGGASGSF